MADVYEGCKSLQWSILSLASVLAGDEVSDTPGESWQSVAGKLAGELEKYAKLLLQAAGGRHGGWVAFPSWSEAIIPPGSLWQYVEKKDIPGAENLTIQEWQEFVSEWEGVFHYRCTGMAVELFDEWTAGR